MESSKMRNKILAPFLALLIPSMIFFGACSFGKQQRQNSLGSVKTAKDFNIDSAEVAAKITEVTVPARQGALVKLLNDRTKDFARITFKSSEEFKDADPKATVFSYVLVIYGDLEIEEKILENGQKTLVSKDEFVEKVLSITGQLLSYTAKFVADQDYEGLIWLQVSLPDGSQMVHRVLPSNFAKLRKAPKENWDQYQETSEMTIVPAELAPIIESIFQNWSGEQSFQKNKDNFKKGGL